MTAGAPTGVPNGRRLRIRSPENWGQGIQLVYLWVHQVDVSTNFPPAQIGIEAPIEGRQSEKEQSEMNNYNDNAIYIPQSQNHWIAFGFKFVGMVGGCALVATLLTGWVHRVSAPGANAPVAQQVAYFAKGIGKVGENAHWLTQASEDTRTWQKAKAYCAGQEGSAGQGCSTVNELANSGY